MISSILYNEKSIFFLFLLYRLIANIQNSSCVAHLQSVGWVTLFLLMTGWMPNDLCVQIVKFVFSRYLTVWHWNLLLLESSSSKTQHIEDHWKNSTQVKQGDTSIFNRTLLIKFLSKWTKSITAYCLPIANTVNISIEFWTQYSAEGGWSLTCSNVVRMLSLQQMTGGGAISHGSCKTAQILG